MRRQQPNRPGVGARASVGAIHRIARRQKSLVTRDQLRELGLHPRAIDRRVEAKRLQPVRRGVYRVGPIRQPFEAEMAAVLAVGPNAFLSHHSAAVLHRLLPYPAKDGLVHVTVIDSEPGRKPGIRIHRTTKLSGDETTRREGIPVTTPARTILDLAPALTPTELEQLIAAAHRQRPANTKALQALVARYPGRPGVPAVRKTLAGRPRFTRSQAERRLLEALRRAGFAPETNTGVGGYEVDLYLPEHRLVIEVDGDPFHSARPDRRRAYARDAALGVIGVRVLRFDADEPIERCLAVIARATR
jgi:very-short-patch-repair endonuclease